jgi:hypothetical protein
MPEGTTGGQGRRRSPQDRSKTRRRRSPQRHRHPVRDRFGGRTRTRFGGGTALATARVRRPFRRTHRTRPGGRTAAASAVTGTRPGVAEPNPLRRGRGRRFGGWRNRRRFGVGGDTAPGAGHALASAGAQATPGSRSVLASAGTKQRPRPTNRTASAARDEGQGESVKDRVAPRVRIRRLRCRWPAAREGPPPRAPGRT